MTPVPVSPQLPPASPPPSFFVRLALPVMPGLWAKARAWSAGDVLLPLVTLSLILSASLGLYRGWGARTWLLTMASEYDQHFDPVIVENGEARVDGPRIILWEEGDSSFLVDPDETVPESALKGRRKIIVRKHELTDSASSRSYSIADLMRALELDTLRLDSASLRSWTNRWSGTLVAGITGLLLLFGVLGDLITCPLYALFGGLLLLPFGGRARGLGHPETFRVALAALTVKPVVGTILSLAGTGMGFCAGFFVWPAVATALGYVALRKLPLAETPSPT